MIHISISYKNLETYGANFGVWGRECRGVPDLAGVNKNDLARATKND
jgi:hypothetical protein